MNEMVFVQNSVSLGRLASVICQAATAHRAAVERARTPFLPPGAQPVVRKNEFLLRIESWGTKIAVNNYNANL